MLLTLAYEAVIETKNHMQSYGFSPFTQPLASFAPSELSALTQVSEGWFIDYKSQAPKTKDLARHLSAFANQHGGWLFIGITENTSAGMTAGGFPGIANTEVTMTLTSLREAAAHHCHPAVFFEHRTIVGPVPEISLPQDRSIVIVGIPESENTPHIHSSGRIYRRQADQSDPKEEIDRHVLDRLWERRVVAHERLERFLTSKPELSQRESKNDCFVFLYLLPRPIPGLARDFPISMKGFQQIMRNNLNGSFGMTFNTFFPTADGFIARQSRKISPEGELLSFRWFQNGTVKVTLPINVLGSHDRLPYPTFNEFANLLKSQGFATRVIDFSICAAVIIVLIGKFLACLELFGPVAAFHANALICGAWRSVPFMNSGSFLDQIRKDGIPVIQSHSMYASPKLSPESLITLFPASSAGGDHADIETAVPLIMSLFRTVGINILEMEDHERASKDFVSAMLESIEIHKRLGG